MTTLITGTSSGIGREIALKFLECGHNVAGIDKLPSTIEHDSYKHYICDILTGELPDTDEIGEVEYLVNNAGVQNSVSDIDVNLKGTMRVTEKYAFSHAIKSVVFIASASAQTGAEFPEYAASKGGVVAYMKNTAQRLSRYGATANSISPGGVVTGLNAHILNDPELWRRVLDETMLRKWATAREIADWTYFVAVCNKSMTAQDILIDNGEAAKFNFIW